MTFTRYALYFAPPAEAAWSRFASQWLGWDLETGSALAQPQIPGLDIEAITQVPRKYGLHATLKPPMRLAPGLDLAELQAACATLAARHAPLSLDGLHLARLGRFLALRVSGDEIVLNALASACVSDLDRFRAPASEAELAKRRAAGLNAAQEENLTRWGYPHVMESFRFHITLTGKLPKADLPEVEAALTTHLVPLLPQPFEIRDLALVGEDSEGRFHLIHRYALTGAVAA